MKCFPLQIFMSGNCSSLFTADVSKKDKGKNQAKVGKQKNKGDWLIAEPSKLLVLEGIFVIWCKIDDSFCALLLKH